MNKWLSSIWMFLKPSTFKILLFFILIGTIFAALIGIPPFGMPQLVGDVIMSQPTILVTTHFYPIFYLFQNHIGLISGRNPEMFKIVILLLVSVIYYYLLSCLLIFIYNKIKKIKMKH